MKRIIQISLIGIVFFALGSCTFTSDVEKEQQEETKINELEKELYKDPLKPIDKNKAETTLTAYVQFTNQFPKNKNTASYLFKAAQLATTLQKYEQAVGFYETIVEKHIDFEKAPIAMFLEAFVYDNYLNNDKKAQEIFKLFISKYPNNELVKDAEFSLKNMGKSDAELIKEFENQTKK